MDNILHMREMPTHKKTLKVETAQQEKPSKLMMYVW